MWVYLEILFISKGKQGSWIKEETHSKYLNVLWRRVVLFLSLWELIYLQVLPKAIQNWWLAETWDRYSDFSLSWYSGFPEFPVFAHYICKANSCSDIILLTKVAGYNICLLPCVHVKVSDITFNIYVCMSIYHFLSLQVLSQLSSDLVKSILSCIFATLYLTQVIYKYDRTVQPNNLSFQCIFSFSLIRMANRIFYVQELQCLWFLFL